MQHYTLPNRVVPPQCQSQVWKKEEGDGKSLFCYKKKKISPLRPATAMGMKW